MRETLVAFEWSTLIGLGLFWLVAVALALGLLHVLFPPTRRQSRERPDLTSAAGGAPLLITPRALPLPPLSITPPVDVESSAVPATRATHWRLNRRLIVFLLLIWAITSIGFPLLAPILNHVRVLTGFPLGYYMGAQGILVIFLVLIFFYAWRMGHLDRRFGLGARGEPREVVALRGRLLRIYGAFALGLAALVLALGLLEVHAGLSPNVIAWMLILLPMGLYAVIGISSRTQDLDEYYVVGRRVPGFFNGLATGSDWMSAASFISMAGTLWLLGYEGLAYIIGWTGGYVLLALLLAPYLRKFGQYTIPDFIGARYRGSGPRVVAALAATIVSFTYVTAQVTGIGIIMGRFLGVRYMLGVVIGLSLVLLCSLLGGMRAVTWTQVAQGIILVIAYLVPVTMLAYRFTGVPIPQLMYGEALKHIAALEEAQGITQAYLTPFNDWSQWNFLALVLCLMLGTAGLPHILIRFYTTDSVPASRSSVGWALLLIALLYFTAPAYAAFSRWEILQNVVGRPIASLPAWTATWQHTGLLTVNDLNGDGILQFSELRISPDLVVVATPEIAGLPMTVAALIAAGGLASALSTADGLLMVIASAMAHDVYFRTINPRASRRERLLLGRIMVLAAAALAALTAVRRLAIIVQMVAWAFSLAAAVFFPVLVLGIFWQRANGRGAVAGMISGLAVTIGYMVLNYLNPDFNILGITHVAAGIFGLPLNILVTIVVSRLTPPPPTEVQTLVDTLRTP